MDEVFTRIMNKGVTPSTTDIVDLLASVGEPGKKRKQKEAAVRRLFDELGVRSVNNQGVHVADNLGIYNEY